MNDIKKINAKAKELGLSYGQYVAMYEKQIKVMNGQWDDAIFDDFDNGMDPEEISDKYRVKELEIAKIYKCTDETIFRRLQRYGLHQPKYEKRS